MDDVHQTTKMTKMGRMTWTTNMNQRSKWCLPVNQDAQVVSTASAVGVVSKWSAQQCCWSSSWDVHNVSTMCSTCCHISVHQGWSSWSSWLSDSQVVSDPDAKWCPSWSSIRFQSGKYGDQVGQQQKQWIQTDVSYVHIG